jgi:ribosomal protein L18
MPRVSVYQIKRNMYVQVIDDTTNKTLLVCQTKLSKVQKVKELYAIG